jgi:hypothetical protein
VAGPSHLACFLRISFHFSFPLFTSPLPVILVLYSFHLLAPAQLSANTGMWLALPTLRIPVSFIVYVSPYYASSRVSHSVQGFHVD